MSEEDAKETLYQALERKPGIVFDILDRISGPGGYHPQPGETTPQWCCCTHCREMPSMVERVCCGYIPEYCISTSPVIHFSSFIHKLIKGICSLF